MAVAPFALDPLLAAVRERSTGIDSHIHGELHWRTVGANGLWLAGSLEAADTQVVLLFALLHDTMRLNDGHDPEHGRRAAAFAGELHAEGLLGIAASQLDLLVHACAEHADGTVSTDPTVGACWDADRLDLPRVGITPRPELFSTDVARSGAHRPAEAPVLGRAVRTRVTVRLAAWNCHQGIDKKRHALDALRADVVVIPECSSGSALGRELGVSFLWRGDNAAKGLAVVGFNGWQVRPLAAAVDLPWVLPVRVHAPDERVAFDLLAIWTVIRKDGRPNYTGQIRLALETWAPVLAEGNMAVAGDFNCSLQGPSRGPHRMNLLRLKELGLESSYHTLAAIEHGQEDAMTLRWIGPGKIPLDYHCDFVFLPQRLLASMTAVRIGWSPERDKQPSTTFRCSSTSRSRWSLNERAAVWCDYLRVRRSTAPSTSWNPDSSGAAFANSVIDERSFLASTEPKICSAVSPLSCVRMRAHSTRRGPSTECCR